MSLTPALLKILSAMGVLVLLVPLGRQFSGGPVGYLNIGLLLTAIVSLCVNFTNPPKLVTVIIVAMHSAAILVLMGGLLFVLAVAESGTRAGASYVYLISCALVVAFLSSVILNVLRIKGTL